MAGSRFDDNEDIKRLLYTIAIGQDRLDWQLFSSLWTNLRPIDVNLTHHVNGYGVHKVSPAELSEMCHGALSGFESSQHLVANIMIDYHEGADQAKLKEQGISKTASVLAYTTAYHFLQQTPDARGDDVKVISRGQWELQVQKELVAGWKLTGITVSNVVPMDGLPELYGIANKRYQEGKGRKPLTEWSKEPNSVKS